MNFEKFERKIIRLSKLLTHASKTRSEICLLQTKAEEASKPNYCLLSLRWMGFIEVEKARVVSKETNLILKLPEFDTTELFPLLSSQPFQYVRFMLP